MSSISISSTSTPSGRKSKKGDQKKKSRLVLSLQASPSGGVKGARLAGKATDSTSNTAPPTPPVVNSPPREITMGLMFENGSPHEAPPGLERAKTSPKTRPRELSPPRTPRPHQAPFGLEPAKDSPKMRPREPSPPRIPDEVPWTPQVRLSEVPVPIIEPHVTNEDLPKPDGIPLGIPACKDCPLPTDVILSSSDGVQFGAHMRNLELYSGRFLAHVPSEDVRRAVNVEENSTVLPLLLRYMHLCPQPDPKAIPFDTLEQLANAVEKYLIYSAMAICKLRMEFYLEQYPAEILRYAAKNSYTNLANEAALLTIGFAYNRIKDAFGGDPDTPRRWLEFKEGWRSALSYAHLTEPEDIPHPTSPSCPWDTFHDGVLRELGPFDPSKLRKIEATFSRERDATMNGLSCIDCEARMAEWETGIITQRNALPEFSAFL